MTSHQREQAIEHLLRRAPGDAVPTSDCLDAETAAAWAEGRLTNAEGEEARVHAADCARCQALMASIAAATPADAQVDREPGWRYWLRWAAPAAAGAVAIVAIAVWLNVRPTPTSMPERMTRNEVSEAPQAPPPTPAPPAAANSQAQAFADDRRRAADRAASNADGVPPAASRRPLAPPAAPPAPARADRLDRLETANGAAATVPAAPQAESADQKTDGAAREPRAAATLDQSIPRPFALREVVSSDRLVRWRLAGDRVERSTDGGTNWTAATRLDSSAITAGSAPGLLVCWLVGRAGVVFLSTDGVTFRQVTSPAPIDLVAISAVDASSATVTASDGRRFITTDGGGTWGLSTVR